MSLMPNNPDGKNYVEDSMDITDEVFEWIEYADTFLVFGTRDYGEDTGNPASSCAESKYAQNQKKRIILIRMIPWEEDFQHLQARVLFGQNKLTLEWQLGTPMPPFLCQQIIDALDVGSRQLDEILRFWWLVFTQQCNFNTNAS